MLTYTNKYIIDEYIDSRTFSDFAVREQLRTYINYFTREIIFEEYYEL